MVCWVGKFASGFCDGLVTLGGSYFFSPVIVEKKSRLFLVGILFFFGGGRGGWRVASMMTWQHCGAPFCSVIVKKLRLFHVYLVRVVFRRGSSRVASLMAWQHWEVPFFFLSLSCNS